MISWIKSVAKAVAAGATAFGGAFATAAVDETITSSEWVTIVVATIAAIAAVWAIANTPQEPVTS